MFVKFEMAEKATLQIRGEGLSFLFSSDRLLIDRQV
jgi:hypothetical protein